MPRQSNQPLKRVRASAPEAPQRSEWAVTRDYEVKTARARRGNCTRCGHIWTPRNPCATVNRCPGCGSRGTVDYRTLNT